MGLSGARARVYQTFNSSSNATDFVLGRDNGYYLMANYTQFATGEIKVKGLKWNYKRLLENFFVFISPGENF